MNKINKLSIFIGIFVLFLVGGMFFYYNSKIESNDASIKTVYCHDKNNEFGKKNLKIPCLNDDDCSYSRMIEFCQPVELAIADCGTKNFCGKDRFCKHDCDVF